MANDKNYIKKEIAQKKDDTLWRVFGCTDLEQDTMTTERLLEWLNGLSDNIVGNTLEDSRILIEDMSNSIKKVVGYIKPIKKINIDTEKYKRLSSLSSSELEHIGKYATTSQIDELFKLWSMETGKKLGLCVEMRKRGLLEINNRLSNALRRAIMRQK